MLGAIAGDIIGSVYEFNNITDAWNIVGSPLLGRGTRDRMGNKVAISEWQ